MSRHVCPRQTVNLTMKTRNLLAGLLLAASALAFVPASDAMAPPSPPSPPVVCLACPQPPTACGPMSGGGGVVGATVTYVGNEKALACAAAQQEAPIVLGAAGSMCDQTVHFATGGNCQLVCTCPPPPSPIAPITVRDVSDQVTVAQATAASSAANPVGTVSSVVVIRCPTVNTGMGGVVGATQDYANGMTGAACNAALAQVGVVATVAFGTCNNTMDYAIGNHYACEIRTTM